MKGRKLSNKALDSRLNSGSLRPTSAKVRESVFNILQSRVSNSVFMDIYAGSGAVGIEAMSRAARTVYFVDNDAATVQALRDTLDSCGCRARAVILREGALDFLRRAHAEGIGADIVFLDPPYDTTELDTVLLFIGQGGVLKEGGLALVEHRTKKSLPEGFGNITKHKTYKYGDTSLTVYEAGA